MNSTDLNTAKSRAGAGQRPGSWASLGAGIIAVGLFAAVVAFGLWMQGRTFCMHDEFYNILNGLDWYNTPFAPLSALTTNILGQCFGWQLLSFRYIAIASYALATLICTVWLWRRIGHFALSMGCGAMCLFLALILRSGDWYFFGWNTFIYPLLSLQVVLVLELARRPGIGLAMAVGLVSAAMILYRIPSAVVVAIVPVLILINRPPHTLKILATYLGAAIVPTVATLCIMYGSPAEWLASLQINLINDHEAGPMFDAYNIHAWMAEMFLAEFFVMYLVFVWLQRRGARPWLITVVGFAMFYGLYVQVRSLNELNAYIFMFQLAVFIMPALVVMAIQPETWRRGPAYDMIVVLALGVVSMCMSNMGLCKWHTFALLPVVLVWYLPALASRPRYYATVIVVLVYILMAQRENERPTSVHTPLLESTTTTDVPLLEGIGMPADLARKVQGEYHAFEPYTRGDYTYCVLGHWASRYWREYLFGWRNPYLRHDWELTDRYTDTAYIAWVDEWLDSAPRPRAVNYCFDRPNPEETPMLQLLTERLPNRTDTPWCIILSD